MTDHGAGPAASRVLAVLGGTHDAARIIEWSASLALTLKREFDVISVESTAALVAASLPFTQVLGSATGRWTPFAETDIERAYRAQAERLRALAARAAQRHDVAWSLRTLRGALPELVFELESDLLFLAPSLHFSASMAALRTARRHLRIAVARQGGASDATLVTLAQRLADALQASLHDIRILPDANALQALRGGAMHADLLVLPRALASVDTLQRLPCPALLVASGAAEPG